MCTRFAISLFPPILTLLLVFGARAAAEEDPDDWEAEIEEIEREWEELEREWEEFLDMETPAWMPVFSVQAGIGYNDNVLRGNSSRQDSFFAHTGIDFMLWRNPEEEGPALHFFLMGENRHYFSNGDLNDERLLSLHAEATFDLATEWSLTLPLDTFYHDELVDVSTREEDLGIVRFQGAGLRFEPTLQYEPSDTDQLRAKLISRHVFLRDPLDDYREIGLGIGWEHNASAATTLTLEWRGVHRRYATREALDSDGAPIAGRRREFVIHNLTGGLRHFWDEARRWESRFGGGIEITRDGEDGFFDFHRPILSHRLIFRQTPWRISAGTRLSHYRFDEWTVEPDDETLERTTVNADVRGEYQLFDRMQLFAEYRHDNVYTNERSASYRVNTALLGAEWMF